MGETGTLLAYYQNRRAARNALGQLRRHRFRRAALLVKLPDGEIHIESLSARRGASMGAAAGLLVGLATGLLVATPTVLLATWIGYLTLCGSAAAGGALGWLVVRYLRLGVQDELVQKHARWLLADETLLIVQAPALSMGRAIALLRAGEEGQLAIFAFHPPHPEMGEPSEPLPWEPLAGDRLKDHARRLAGRHNLLRGPSRGEPLLSRLKQCEKTIEHVRRDLSEASRLEQAISQAAEWLLDNAYVLQGQIADVRRNLPRRFYHELPLLAGGPNQDLPRVYELALELVVHSDARLDRQTISEFLSAYQSVQVLTTAELWALPLMLRIALIEAVDRLARQADDRLHQREQADFWANRLIIAARRDPDHLLFLLAELSRHVPDAGPYFAFQLASHLYDEEAALIPARSWIERKLGRSLREIILQEQGHLAGGQVSIANAITTLRQLSLLDWREIFEQHSQVESLLADDPSGVYPRMDFDTRDLYRHAVEQMARWSGRPEADAARAAVQTAANADAGDDPRRRHIGYWLVDDGRRPLERQMGCRPTFGHRLLRFVYRHHAGLYMGAVATLTILIVAGLAALGLGAGPPAAVIGLMALAVLPASELALQIVNYLVTRLLPPRRLCKMSFEKEGIPPQFKTLVVVPMMLLTRDSIRQQVDRLEVHYLANPDPNLLFSLFADYGDAPQKHAPEDEDLLDVAIRGIEALNSRYGPGRFLLFHRERTWTDSEQRWIGWERKRGKLEELNRLLTGRPSRDGQDIVRVGDPQNLAGVRYVITLDADTQLPRDSACRLVETMAHPLNRARAAADGRTVHVGFGLVQPRVTTSLPSATATRFSRIFTDPTGTDPYTRAVSDVYQDLSGRGTYHGKGIYDPHVFDAVLGERFPEQALLSHDLIEGAHMRAGLASDIELLDDFPQNYRAYSSREHRWIRGDWQIAEYCLPWARPSKRGGRWARNPLAGMSRWKIFDNLRRSLVPGGCVLLLAAGWLIGPLTAAIASALVAAVLLVPPLTVLVTWLTSPPVNIVGPWPQLKTALWRAVMTAALLPHMAGVALDAIVRVWFRRLVSRRRLLEWTTAQVSHWRADNGQRAFLLNVSVVSLVAVALAVGVSLFCPAAWIAAAPFLALWLTSPLAVHWLNQPTRPAGLEGRLRPQDRQKLRDLARQTWRYFEQFVGPSHHWLPPDNYQVSYRDELAPRTSPTNIGLSLLSSLAAHDLGYLTIDQLTERLGRSFQTLDRLERYQGHLLNWYDIETLRPLMPRYVSFVDSGNLIASLWTLQRGIAEQLDSPLIGEAALDGLTDTLRLLRRSLEELTAGRPAGEPADQALRALARLIEAPLAEPPLPDLIGRIRASAEPARLLARSLQEADPAFEEPAYWAGQLDSQINAWLDLVGRYLDWIEPVVSLPPEGLELLDRAAAQARREALTVAPSLTALADGQVRPVELLLKLSERSDELAPPLVDALARLQERFSRCRWLAGERISAGPPSAQEPAATGARALIQRAGKLADGINLRFLYDPARRLFAIGQNVEDGRPDRSFYDLLASEARLASFVAIARHDVPAEHWLAMARPYRNVFGRRALLSWAGTMFEYAMPLLLMRLFDNSLLDQACRQAVAIHVAYGRWRGVPWGMSESAFSALDLHRTYQYRAFGVPGLGLKRGLEDDLVVSPYATLLALPIEPRQAIRNLDRLIRLGLGGDVGLFEAIDFSRQRTPGGERGVVVHAYMAHHQGMILLALDNFLCGRRMVRRFHADPRVRATESLLFERIPHAPPAFLGTVRERGPERFAPAGPPMPLSRFQTPHTETPKTQLLANGPYAMMVTNAGGGYSRWRQFDISRWRSDTTADRHGSFCYLRDRDGGQVWSNTYAPTGRQGRGYTASFPVDRAEFRRTDDGIETLTEIVVSPEDDAEIRRVTLVNRSGRTRRLELTSYVELALAPHAADRVHPAFNKLFVQTEAVRPWSALIAWRRKRSPDEPSVWAGHLIAAAEPAEPAVQFETDRARFIGRGRSLQNPVAMEADLSGTAGTVLDPVFSLRRRVELAPGERARLALVTVAGESRQAVLSLLEKYSDLRAAGRALELAWSKAQLELRHLRIQPPEAQRFQQLASHVLYPNPRLRPPSSRLQQNQLGQARLWPHGISGDDPIVLVTVDEWRDIQLVREVLQAHTYWRMRGLVADLVILNEEAAGYEQTLQEQLGKMIQAHSMLTGVDQPGGVFLRRADHMPAEDVTLLTAAARVVLVATRGPLPQQFSTPPETVEPPPLLTIAQAPAEEPSPPLPFMELPYFNGLGGFTPDGREYAIYLGPGTATTAPWVNVMANPLFGQVISESGGGFVWSVNSQGNRITGWSNDPVCDRPSEAIYIRDEDSGVFWTPTPQPVRELDAYRTRHGAGYTVFEHNSHAICQELLSFVPMDDEGGRSVRIQRLRLRSNSRRRRRLTVTLFAELTLGTDREQMQMHVTSAWNSRAQMLLARNAYNPDFGGQVTFVASSPAPASFTGDRALFLGRNGSLDRPAAMRRRHLSRQTGAALDPAAAIQVAVELDPGQSVDILFLLGQADNAQQAESLVRQFRQPTRVEQALQATCEWWDARLGRLQVKTPELSTNFLLNRWLAYQSLSCRMWARSAVYQSGGAYGFRDQLQDALALVLIQPQVTRQQILRAAARQFLEGDVQHWWHPRSGAGVRSRCSDDLLWLPWAVAEYVRVTGDLAILDQSVRFLEGRALADDEAEALFVPDESAEQTSLLDHCRRAIELSLGRFGPHDLPLIGAGDWNDGLNRVGAAGKGESVWLAWFLIRVLGDFADLCRQKGQTELADRYRSGAEELAQAVEQHAWDGEWYLRGYFDDGTPLGSRDSEQARIDSLPQSWAVLSGSADPDRARQAVESAWDDLVRPDERLAVLFDPPFDNPSQDPGYVAAYPPGIRENGGQYTHGALWLAMALARLGDGDRADQLLRMLNPVERTRLPEDVARYRVEPYVVAADVYSAPGREGQGGWTWYTGSAGWMYRVWIEEVLGFKRRGETLRIEPVIPADWDEFDIHYRYESTDYDIHVANPDHVNRGVVSVELDGEPLADKVVPLTDDEKPHRVQVRLGRPAAAGKTASEN